MIGQAGQHPGSHQGGKKNLGNELDFIVLDRQGSTVLPFLEKQVMQVVPTGAVVWRRSSTVFPCISGQCIREYVADLA